VPSIHFGIDKSNGSLVIDQALNAWNTVSPVAPPGVRPSETDYANTIIKGVSPGISAI